MRAKAVNEFEQGGDPYKIAGLGLTFQQEIDQIVDHDVLWNFAWEWMDENDLPSMSLDELMVQEDINMTEKQRAEGQIILDRFDNIPF
jgi:hypothetical protein